MLNMKLLKNLAEVSKEEQSIFLKSFDHVLTDLDGVIWLVHKAIPGATDCIESFQQQGKKVRYITNNPLNTVVQICDNLVREGFDAQLEDVITPMLSLITYLKEINFNKKLFVIGTIPLREELSKANFKIAQNSPPIDESVATIMRNIEDDEDIGAVIYSFDFNMSFINLQKAVTYLKRKDCLFLVTLGDREIPVGFLGPLLGPEYFINMLRDFTGNEYRIVGKPSPYFAEFTTKKLGLTNPKRVLFIGDQIKQDMNFANLGGFQKLLVLTGIAKIEDINDWQYPEEYKPEYYVESLKVLNDILQSTTDPTN